MRFIIADVTAASFTNSIANKTLSAINADYYLHCYSGIRSNIV